MTNMNVFVVLYKSRDKARYDIQSVNLKFN
jgi:hypothetical protein